MPCPDNILIAYASRLGSTAEVAKPLPMKSVLMPIGSGLSTVWQDMTP